MDLNGTPRARPGLKFANRVYQASPLNPNKRLGTPQTAPSRKIGSRDDLNSSTMNHSSSISASRNIFRSSVTSNSSSTTPFSPKLPAETKTKVFAPGNTPNSQRVYREVTAQATPRGMSARATSADLFTMRIPSPPPELTGEALAKKVPSELDAKGTVYADQFLSHLVPAEYDDLQRRQLLCILDLRRLKHSANEVFAKKDWKLNIMNFAKEFEKSRSLIMLRYGLYEFKNVKPSDDVLRKWRTAHGLPEPEEDTQAASSPSKAKSSRTFSSSKRKADDDLDPSKDASSTKSKKRAFEQNEAPAATPAANKNKRKASISGDSDDNVPSKMAKSTSSATKAMFEKAFNKSSVGPAGPKATPTDPAPAPAPNPFAAAAVTSQSANGGPTKSVFDNLKPPQNSGNIFSYLSDTSAKNSGADADAESDSDSDEADTQGTGGQSDGPSVAASGGVATPSLQPTSNLFASQKPLLPPTTSSAAGSRESTPGRSLFDRVTKGNDGQPLRAESTEPAAEKDDSVKSNGTAKEPSPDKFPAAPAPAAPVNATWNPGTPIKFGSGAATSSGSLFGASATTTPASSLFGQKPASTSSASNMFGAPKAQEKPKDTLAEESAALSKQAQEADKSGESDKENDSQPASKPVFGGFTPKSADPATAAPSLFQSKPATDSAPKPAAPMFSFGASKPDESKTTSAPASSLFGAEKPKEPVLQSSTLFGGSAKPAEASKPAASDAAKPTGLFGAATTAAPTSSAAGLFGTSSQPTSGPTSNLFGNANYSAKPSNGTDAGANGTPALFGKPSSTPPPTFGLAPAKTFTFGADKPAESAPATSEAPKPIFGGITSTPVAPPPSHNPLFGSPMKQDDKSAEPSPAKKLFGASSSEQPSTLFSFGASQSAPSTNLFGASTSAPSQTNGQESASSSFTFGANNGGNSANQSFNNPFAFGGGSGGSSTTPPANSQAQGGTFNFSSGGSSAPSFGASTSTSFQFGAAPATQPSQPATSSAPSSNMFSFGGTTATAPAPSMSFGASQSQSDNIFAPKPSQFGGNLQPPGAGASTTGTNSPFNLGGASSLATTPATGTPEPTADREKTSANAPSDKLEAPGAAEGDDSEGKPHEQAKLTESGAGEEDEDVMHEVRCKVLKFVPVSEQEAESGDENKDKAKSPWVTKGIGPFRLLKHKTSGAVRMLVRAEPRGHVVLNRSLLPKENYKAESKYVKLLTSNESGDGLETWMMQVKNNDIAKVLAEALEKEKGDGAA